MLFPKPPKLMDDLHQKLFELTTEISEKHQLKNGRTALFWHLHSIVEQHIQEGKKESDKP